MFDDDDYYDEQNDYDDSDYDLAAAIGYIRSKLDKSVKITDNTIEKELQRQNWNEDKALKAIKKSLQNPAQNSLSGAKSTANTNKKATAKVSTAVTKPSSNSGTKSQAMASQPTTASASIEVSKSDYSPSSVFTKIEEVAVNDDIEIGNEKDEDGSGDISISDDETVLLDSSSTPLPSQPSTGTTAKPELTMIVVGHVDAGKSTLVGNLLHKLGRVTQKLMHKNEKEAKTIGKGSFSLAWVMDERKSERERGVTIDVAERTLSTNSRNFTILDAPGHKDFVPNMIKGAAQADVALLVVPASAGEFETCMSPHAQTREHASLLKALGVNQVVIVVNKMDSTGGRPWSQQRYHQIESEVRRFLVNDLNFHDRLVRCLPLSGLTGENLISMSNECPGKSWYSGDTLQAALDTFLVPPKQVDKAFRAVVTEMKQISKHELELQVVVLQGKIRKGRTIGVASYSNHHCRVTSASVNSIKTVAFESEMEIPSDLEIVSARERAVIRVVSRQGGSLDVNDYDEIILFKGPPILKPLTSFRASITTMNNIEVPIIPGSRFEIYLKGVEMQCIISHIHNIAGTTKKPKCVPSGKNATVTISIEHSTVVEPFNTCRALGRFALRFRGATIAVGSCEDNGHHV